MYRFSILFLALIVSIPVFATKTAVTQFPYNTRYYSPQAYYGGDYIPNRRFIQRRPNSPFYDINDLERYAFNRNFTRESNRSRLERLETLAFGTIQEGDITTRYDNVRNAILARPKQNYKTSLLKNISDYFNGQITGFTPSLNQSNYYSQPYGINSSTGYSSPWGNGYSFNNYGINSGSSVQILD